MENSEISKVFPKRKKENLQIDTQQGSERGASLQQFESLIWDISFGFPLADYFDMPDFQSVFGTYQDLPCVNMCIFQPRWILAEAFGELDIILLLTSNEPVSWEDLLDLENEK